jgi:hypothetical protein
MNPPSELRSLELITRLKRDPSEHKGSAGKVLLIGGAPGMAGALMLSGSAALHLGAGWTILEMLDPTAATRCHCDWAGPRFFCASERLAHCGTRIPKNSTAY